MKELFLVALGGAIGSVLRWKLGGLILARTAGSAIPLGTLAVNIAGCIAAGLAAGLVIKHDAFSPAGGGGGGARLFLFTGLLGGFTTFSAFGVESMHLLRRGAFTPAALYILASVGGGIGGLMLAAALIPGRSPP